MWEILQQRKELFRREKEELKRRYISVTRQLDNLSPDSPSYARLLKEKESLTVQLYSKDLEHEKKIEYLEKRVQELGEEPPQKKGLFDYYKEGFKDKVSQIRDDSTIVKLLDFSARLAYASTKASLKGASLVAKTGLNALLTKKVGGRKRFGITFGGKRQGKYKFNDNFMRRYSSDYKKLYDNFYMLGKGFYNRNIKKGQVSSEDVINYLRDQGKSTEEIREQISMLMDQGFEVSKTIKEVLFPETPIRSAEELNEDLYDSVSSQNRAIELDDMNKETLRETLYDFYDYIDRKDKKKKNKGGGALKKLFGSIFGLIKGLGTALLGIAAFLGPGGVVLLVAAAVGLFSYFWSDIKTFFLKKIDDVFGTTFSKEEDAYPQTSLNEAGYNSYLDPKEMSVDPQQSKYFDLSDNVSSLGQLSSKYEGRADTVSSGYGDKGGVSFGKYQFASKTGGLASFMNELKASNPEYYDKLMENGAEFYKDRNANKQFQENWKKLAREDKGFAQAQDEIAKKKWFDPAVEKFKERTGVDPTESKALSNALWSASIQHGGIGTIIDNAGIKEGQSTEEMIDRLYGSRADYVSGLNIANKKGIYNRYTNERQDAFLMAQQERIMKDNSLADAKTANSDIMLADRDIIGEEEQKIAMENSSKAMSGNSANAKNTDKLPAPIKIASHLGGAGLDLLNTGARV